MNWIDYTIIVMLGLFAIWGVSKGLVKMAFSIGGYILGFIGARIFSPPVIKFLNESTKIAENIKNWFVERLEKIAGVSSANESFASMELKNAYDNPEFQAAMSDNSLLKDIFFGGSQSDSMRESTVQVAEFLANMIVYAVVFLLLFVIIKVIISLVGIALDKGLKNIKVVSALNRFGGLTLGIIGAALILTVIISLLLPLAATSNTGFISTGLNNSQIVTYLNEKNYFSIMVDIKALIQASL